MALTAENQAFEEEWIGVAKEIAKRILELPEIKELKNNLNNNGFLSVEEKSQFIAITNKVKYDVIYEKYGKPESDTFEKFNQRWKAWFNNKGTESESRWGKKLTNEEHIIFGSTPDAEEFLRES